jgi:hypothetical protein
MGIHYSLKRIPITFKWEFKIKTKLDGIIDNFITRLVAKGFSQIHGVDYTKQNSLVIKPNSIKVLLTLITQYDLEMHKLDVKTTFVNGFLEEDVHDHTIRIVNSSQSTNHM